MPLFEDNQATIEMIQEDKPTNRSHHIDVQWFAIQEWRQKGDVIMEHLSGLINPSDGLTKALGWVLHAWHACRGMGHYNLGSP